MLNQNVIEKQNNTPELSGNYPSVENFIQKVEETFSKIFSVDETGIATDSLGIRYAMAINLQMGHSVFLVKRDDSIYKLGMPLAQQINLGKLDCFIASRPILPNNSTNTYGLFGKAELTRDKQDLFLNLTCDFIASNFSVEEVNSETEEKCVMFCGTLVVQESSELRELLVNSKNVICVDSEQFIADEENSTAKLLACRK